MNRLTASATLLMMTLGALWLAAEMTNMAEDDASVSAYSGGWSDGSNGGSGFGKWTFTTEGNDNDRHSGFFIAETKNNRDLTGIAKSDKAFGLFANGSGYEQAVAYRPFEKPLQAGDSFSFMIEHGPFEKKFAEDDPTPGAIGLVLRTSNATASVAEYNKDAAFEFGFYQGKTNYQIYDGNEQADSGVPVTDAGISVTVTVTGPGTYDLEIQTLKDKKLTKLGSRNFKGSGAIQSMSVFDRNGEKNDAYFNQFQVAREVK